MTTNEDALWAEWFAARSAEVGLAKTFSEGAVLKTRGLLPMRPCQSCSGVEEHRAHCTTLTPAAGGNRMMGTTQPYARVKPCIDQSGHKFTATYPPAGQWGYTLIVCQRCGETKREATE